MQAVVDTSRILGQPSSSSSSKGSMGSHVSKHGNKVQRPRHPQAAVERQQQHQEQQQQ